VTYEEEKKLYRNSGKGMFVDVTNLQGAEFRAPRVGRGLAVGDYDNDGWQDFLVSNNGEDAQLFRNEGASLPVTKNNHWVAIQLVGTKSNRDAIGTQLKLVAGDLISYDEAKGGMSYCSAQDPRIFFGLGARDHIDSLEIRWPSGIKETITNVPVNTFLRIEEGKNAAEVLHNGMVKNVVSKP
jgi:enediyne biosynthesis protein E4